MNVFIGGSRAVSRLNETLRARIDDFMRRGDTILIGDANGADKAVQEYLAASGYRNVTVYCMEECRNNVGLWPTRNVKPPGARKDFSYYAAKDSVMAQEAKCGVMLWDAKSKGTLRNILNLVSAGKRTLVYFAPTRDFHVVATEQGLQELLARCEGRDIETAIRGLGLKLPIDQARLPLSVSGV
ncbi:MAG: hypothetical protein ABR976_08650 [Terracidiphilus sp.]|jgi:acyl CoA:acetate/3-ketoacid CoA transferase alpha subunit